MKLYETLSAAMRCSLTVDTTTPLDWLLVDIIKELEEEVQHLKVCVISDENRLAELDKAISNLAYTKKDK
jgi:hypothetical protein